MELSSPCVCSNYISPVASHRPHFRLQMRRSSDKAGKIHVGIILGWVTVSAMFLYVVLNMLAGRNGNLDVSYAISILSEEELEALQALKVIWENVWNNCANRTVCMEKLSLMLPETPPYIPKQFGRCAVIGNSGDLLKTRFGKEIDSYDAVVRENGAPIQLLSFMISVMISKHIKRISGKMIWMNLKALCSITWTKSMWRLYYLVDCFKLHEPVLLVGETGGGKTTICQLLSSVLGSKLHILNCHQYTETSDFLGGFRPLREREIEAEL